MTQRFVIEVQDKRGSGSSARGSSQSSTSNPAALLDAQAKAAEKAAKAATDAQVREGKRAQQAALAYSQIIERESNRIGAIQARAAKKAADDQAREAKRGADSVIREQQRASREIERAARTAALANSRAQQQALQATFRGTRAASGGVGTIGAGIGGAAATLAGGASGAVSGILGGSLLSGDPIRAIAGLATSGLKAGAQLAGAIGKGLGQALPGALSAVGGIIGSVFSGAGGPVGGLLGKIVGNLAGGLSKAIGAALSIAGELGGILTSAVGEIAGFIGDKLGLALKVAIGGAAGVAFLGLKDALAADEISSLFTKFAADSGVTAKEGVEKLRTATQGLISDLDLMRQAQAAQRTDAVQNLSQFAELAQFADQLGDSLGIKAKDALDLVTDALGSLQSKGLKKALGASVDFEAATKRVAAANGLLVDELTENDKRAIAFGVTIDALHRKFDGLAKAADSPSDNFDRLHASIDNSLLSIGNSLLPALDRVLKAVEPIAKAVGTFFDNNNKQVADGIANAVGTLTDKLAKVPAIIANIKLDEVFGLIGQAAVGVWDAFTLASQAAFVVVEAQAQNLFDTLAEEAKDLVPFSRVNLQGRSKSEQADFDKARVSRDNGLRTGTSNAQAGAILNQASGNLGALGASIAAQLAAIAARAGTGALPAATPTQPAAHPLASLGGGGGSTFTAGGSQQSTFRNATKAGKEPVDPLGSIVLEGSNAITGAVAKAVANIDEVAALLGVSRDRLAEVLPEDIRLRESEIEDVKQNIAQEHATLTEQKRHDDAIRKINTSNEDQTRKIGLSLTRGIDEILTKLQDTKDKIVRQQQEGKAASATSALIGGVGGFDADDSGIPAKLKRAAAKVRRVANRERKNSLNQASAGLSVDELAANGGQQLQGIIAAQGQKEGQKPNGLLEALDLQKKLTEAKIAADEQITQLQKDKLDALNDLAEKTNELSKAEEEAHKAELDIHNEQIAIARDQADAIKTLQEDLKKVQKALADIPRVGGR